MATEFGWWNKDPEDGKYQVVAEVHGGSVAWTRKGGHHQPWLTHTPSEDDWERLLAEATRRVPRRLLSPKQFAEIKDLCDRRVGSSWGTKVPIVGDKWQRPPSEKGPPEA